MAQFNLMHRGRTLDRRRDGLSVLLDLPPLSSNVQSDFLARLDALVTVRTLYRESSR